MKSKKPSKAKLEEHLKAGALIADIARKYDASKQSVKNWIRDYGLEGIQVVKKTEDKPAVIRNAPPINNTPPVDDTPPPQDTPPVTDNDMVQSSPTQAELEQFHTDEPLQELPVVDIGPDLCPCADCGKGFWTDGFSTICPDCSGSLDKQGMTEEGNMTNEEYDRIMATVEVQVITPVEIPEPEMKIYSCLDCGKKFFSEEYADLCNTCYESLSESPESVNSPDPVPAPPEKPFAEIWQNSLEDLAALKRSYVTLAQQEFKDGLLAMVAYLVG